MILLTIVAAMQFFITGASNFPPPGLFILTILGATLETVIEIKILSIKGE